MLMVLKPIDTVQPNTAEDSEKKLKNISRVICVVVLTALLCGISSGLLMMLLHFVAHSAWKYSDGTLIVAIGNEKIRYRMMIFVVNGLFVGVCKLLTSRLIPGETSIAGAIWKGKNLDFLPSFFKSIISIIAIALGCSLGREVAPQLVGAAVASEMHKFFSQKFQFLSDNHRPLLVAIGAGCSFAAVYQVPLGGALLTLEIWLGSLSRQNSIVVIIGCCLAAFTGTFLDLVVPYSVSLTTQMPYIIIPAILIGITNGFLFTGYVRAVQLLDPLKPKASWQIALYPMVALTILGGLCIPYPELAGNGSNLSQMLFSETVSWDFLAAMFFLKPFVIFLCLTSGTPGGLFTPTFTCGAIVGGILGKACAYFLPAISVQTCAFLGAASAIAVSLQAPLAALGLTLELVQDFSSVTPVMFASSIGLLISRYFKSPSTYTARKE
ncbi:hypothetical protein HK103_006209 [Boothiomyces macroporosus]|uniref:Chloride channel protein n=1 Tax=Boothiomyces macroporosus TaxID=261099 RepID=A0AAD5UE19_9FUNG|nr:hypothetical protein HK103_006209 [Boothiomyces macroporosus]